MTRFSTNLVLLLCWLALAAAVAYMWFNPPTPARIDLVGLPDRDVRPDGLDSDGALVAPAPLEAYREIVERPLFFQARRPPEPEEEESPEPAAPVEADDDELVLVGVMQVGEAVTALVQNQTTGKVSRLKIGMTMEGGWSAAKIAANQITLTRDGETKMLELIRNQRRPSATIGKQVESLRQQRLLARQRRQQNDAAQQPDPAAPPPLTENEQLELQQLRELQQNQALNEDQLQRLKQLQNQQLQFLQQQQNRLLQNQLQQNQQIQQQIQQQNLPTQNQLQQNQPIQQTNQQPGQSLQGGQQPVDPVADVQQNAQPAARGEPLPIPVLTPDNSTGQ